MQNSPQCLEQITEVDLSKMALHDHILRSVSDGIHVIDMNGTVLIENEASAHMLGWCDDCLVGKQGHAAIHHHHADGSQFPAETCPIYATLKDGVAREISDDVFWRQDGSSFPVEYRTAPLFDALGKQYGVTVVFRDITERQWAAQMRTALHNIAECAHDCETPSALYPKVHDIIHQIIPADRLYIALLDEHAMLLRFPYWKDGHSQAPEPISLAMGGYTAQVMREANPLLLVGHDETSLLASRRAYSDWLGVPLRNGKKVVGALVIQNAAGSRRYVEADKDLLQFVSTQLATSIERTHRDERLRHLAQFDPLTDLPNRALFDDRLQVALSKSRRREEKLALMFLDLDKFKLVNDTYGHAVGDALLVAVANRIKSLLRESDTVGRVGGDEFVILLHPVVSVDDVTLVAEKIRHALAQTFDLLDQRISISASIGVALYPQHGRDEINLARAADRAMYQAKRDGSDRFCIAV
jgi:diguanylate cyclase (GGDEF)-like protein/PAS domain S-box-containing protein